ATVNLRPFPTASVHLGRAEGHDPTDTEGIWLDPARRAPARGGTRRLHDPEEYDPPLSTVVELASRLGRHGEHGPLGAKLGPGIDPGVLPARTETQWLSLHGQVLEATCWFGPLAAPGTRSSALVITRAGAHRLERTDDPPSASTAYPTADPRHDSPFAKGYAVRDVMPFGPKRLISYRREHRLGVLEIKKRGTAVEPEELRRQLRPRRFGEESATLILTRIA